MGSISLRIRVYSLMRFFLLEASLIFNLKSFSAMVISTLLGVMI